MRYPKFWNNKNWLATILIPFSWIYLLLAVFRNFLSSPVRLSATVICVGNMSVGGTGKTQLVIWLAGLLKKQGVSFVIISKGYGSNLKTPTLVSDANTALEVGDEAILLSQHGPVIASPKILEAIPLLKTMDLDVIIVDDGMQNPSFIKDFIILTIDSLRGEGNGLIIPAGPLRENVNFAFNKADMILMLGNKDCVTKTLLTNIKNSQKPFYYGQIQPINKIDKSKKYIAFTGIGNPDKFFSLLKELQMKVIDQISYPDHYNYQDLDITKLKEQAKNQDATLITTAKDYVKIQDKDIQCLKIKLNFEKESEIIGLINEKITKKN
jgi:tetraacyldisaccharide 4'-kinase